MLIRPWVFQGWLAVWDVQYNKVGLVSGSKAQFVNMPASTRELEEGRQISKRVTRSSLKSSSKEQQAPLGPLATLAPFEPRTGPSLDNASVTEKKQGQTSTKASRSRRRREPLTEDTGSGPNTRRVAQQRRRQRGREVADMVAFGDANRPEPTGGPRSRKKKDVDELSVVEGLNSGSSCFMFLPRAILIPTPSSQTGTAGLEIAVESTGMRPVAQY